MSVAGSSGDILKPTSALTSSPAPSANLTSLSQLASGASRTRGEIPPPLVGASVTRVGELVVVFGGRPTSSRTPIASLWELDLNKLVWKLLWNASGDGNGPAARYFASATAFGSNLVVFGGQGRAREEDVEHSPTTLGDLWIWDTETKSWESPDVSLAPGVTPPSPRYAHLAVLNTTSSFSFLHSSATLNSTLTLIGGQDADNRYISSTSTLDLGTMTWTAESPYSKSCGTYGSAAVSSQLTLVPTRQRRELHTPDLEGKSEEDFFELSHSIVPEEDEPEPIFVYSNSSHHAFAETQRELDLLLPFDPTSPPSPPLDLSNRMFGAPSLPPRLRFPSASITGRHLILSGISLSPDDDEGHYAVWALDLGRVGGVGVAQDLSEPLRWKQIETREVLAKGSWNRGVEWKSSLLVLGDRRRDAAKDYAQRQLNFSHLAVINLEPNGIYQLPPQALPPSTQHLGLVTLSQPSLFDYAIVCIDKTILPCPRRVLESRWPWFRDELAKEEETAPPPSPSSRKIIVSQTHLAFPYTPNLALALLQYLATLSLCTKHQLSYDSLAGLLAFTDSNDTVPGLRPLVIHTLHEMLSNDSSLASKVYEAATKGGSSSLAVHALKLTMMGMERASSPKGAGRMRPSLTSDGVTFTRVPSAPHFPPPPGSRSTSLAPSSPSFQIITNFSSGSRSPQMSPRSSIGPPAYSPSTPYRRPSMAPSFAGSDSTTAAHAAAAAYPSPAPSPPISAEMFALLPLPDAPTLDHPPSLPLPPPSLPLSPATRPQVPPSPASRTRSSSVAPSTASSTISLFSRKSKHLRATLLSPPEKGFVPGGVLSVMVDAFAGTKPLSDAFSSLRVMLKGTSGVQSGGGLPELHTILDTSLEVDLSSLSDKTSTILHLPIPVNHSCSCRSHEEGELPPTSSMIFGRSNASREGEESGLVVIYKVEFRVKTKGLVGKIEKLSLPFALSSPMPFGPNITTSLSLTLAHSLSATVPLSQFRHAHLTSLSIKTRANISTPTAEDTYARLHRLGLTSLAQPSFVPSHLQPAEITSATLSYWISSLGPSGAYLAWRLTLRGPARLGAESLLPFLKDGCITVFIARRIVPLLSTKQGGGEGPAKAFKLDVMPEALGMGMPMVLAGEEDDSEGGVSARLSGWMVLDEEELRVTKSCNGELRHFLVAAISSEMFEQGFNINVQLHQPFPMTPLPFIPARRK